VYAIEADGNPALYSPQTAESFDTQGAKGNMEGKEVRFGIAGSALFADVSTASSDGAVNSMHDSFMPLSGRRAGARWAWQCWTAWIFRGSLCLLLGRRYQWQRLCWLERQFAVLQSDTRARYVCWPFLRCHSGFGTCWVARSAACHPAHKRYAAD
jgi:hypothetical protein